MLRNFFEDDLKVKLKVKYGDRTSRRFVEAQQKVVVALKELLEAWAIGHPEKPKGSFSDKELISILKTEMRTHPLYFLDVVIVKSKKYVVAGKEEMIIAIEPTTDEQGVTTLMANYMWGHPR